MAAPNLSGSMHPGKAGYGFSTMMSARDGAGH